MYHEALIYLPVLILGTIFNTVVSFYSAIYIAKKLTKQVTNTSIIAAVINLVVNLALIWFIGIWAAAISTVVAYGVMAVYRHYDMRKYVTVTYDKKMFAILALLFSVTVTAFYSGVWWVQAAGLVVSLVVGGVVGRGELRSVVGVVRGASKTYSKEAEITIS